MIQATVHLVDDNQAVRDSIVWMLEREGIQVEAYATPGDLLKAYDPKSRGCLVLDLSLPEMSGLELRDRLVEMGCRLPFIIITGCGEVPDATRAIKLGAVDFMEKPLDRDIFLDRVWQALDKDTRQRRERADHDSVQNLLDELTPREREVLELVVAGKLTKQIARQFGISVKTIEVHRSNITRKMQVDSVAQLVRIVTEHRISNTAAQSLPSQHPAVRDEV